MYSIEFVAAIKQIISLPNGYSVLAKSGKYLCLKQQLCEYTSFLDPNVKIKERCEYVLRGLTSQKTCACGCGEYVSTIFNNFINNHSHKHDDVKKAWQEARQTTMKTRWYDTNKKHEIYDKVKKTNIKKYGHEFVFQTDEFKNKSKSTFLEKYGVDNCSKHSGVKERKKRTYKQNYNAEYNSSPEIISKIIKSRYRNTFLKFERFSNIVLPIFSIEDFIGGGKQYNWKCQTCDLEFIAEYDDGLVPRCSHCFPPHMKFAENEVFEFLSTFGFSVIRNTRKIIAPLELDFFIPECNIAIEYNGLYWHQHHPLSNFKYHYNKTILCKDEKIRLIHIFEDEWIHKRDIVQSRLKNMISSQSLCKIYARKCKIVQIDSVVKNKFLNENHLQGEDKSSIYYGLENEDGELVSIMTFGAPRFSKKYEYELIRFCSKINTVVIGGASKLLKHFKQQHKPRSIITYADLRWSAPLNNLYNELGFSYSHTSNPNFWYFKRNKRYSRYGFQKHKLSKIFSNFDSSLTAEENIKANGYSKIYDCGNLVYIWINPN
jgi:hypothetical protein